LLVIVRYGCGELTGVLGSSGRSFAKLTKFRKLRKEIVVDADGL